MPSQMHPQRGKTERENGSILIHLSPIMPKLDAYCRILSLNVCHILNRYTTVNSQGKCPIIFYIHIFGTPDNEYKQAMQFVKIKIKMYRNSKMVFLCLHTLIKLSKQCMKCCV